MITSPFLPPIPRSRDRIGSKCRPKMSPRKQRTPKVIAPPEPILSSSRISSRCKNPTSPLLESALKCSEKCHTLNNGLGGTYLNYLCKHLNIFLSGVMIHEHFHYSVLLDLCWCCQAIDKDQIALNRIFHLITR